MHAPTIYFTNTHTCFDVYSFLFLASLTSSKLINFFLLHSKFQLKHRQLCQTDLINLLRLHNQCGLAMFVGFRVDALMRIPNWFNLSRLVRVNGPFVASWRCSITSRHPCCQQQFSGQFHLCTHVHGLAKSTCAWVKLMAKR